MTVRIAVDQPRAPLLGRLRRDALWLAGVALVLIGLVAVVFPMLFMIIAIMSLVVPPHDFILRSLDVKALFQVVIPTIVAIVCLKFGVRLARGRRRLVVFLRRFGLTETTRVVSYAVATAMGGRWRLVTLDDAETDPVGVQRRSRWIAIVAILVGLVLMAMALRYIFGGGFDATVRHMLEDMLKEKPGETFPQLLGRFIGSVAVAFVAGFFVVILVAIGATAAGVATAFSWVSYASIRKAEHAKAMTVQSAAAIEPAVAEIVRRTHGIFAPRLIVVKVANRVWQKLVIRLVDSASAVVVDVSEPTENLLWEIEALRREHGLKWLPIGEDDRVDALIKGGRRATGLERRFLQLLDGEEVLAYASDRRADMKRFSRQLYSRLDRLG